MGETFGWREHRLLQGDGRGGYLVHPAAYRFVPRWNGIKVLPFGIVAMDNGELLLMGATRTGDGPSVYGETVQARSADGGATWSPYKASHRRAHQHRRRWALPRRTPSGAGASALLQPRLRPHLGR